MTSSPLSSLLRILCRALGCSICRESSMTDSVSSASSSSLSCMSCCCNRGRSVCCAMMSFSCSLACSSRSSVAAKDISCCPNSFRSPFAASIGVVSSGLPATDTMFAGAASAVAFLGVGGDLSFANVTSSCCLGRKLALMSPAPGKKLNTGTRTRWGLYCQTSALSSMMTHIAVFW